MSGIESIESIPNPGRTIEGLRDTGYNFETAVADLVDNSIAAGGHEGECSGDAGFPGECPAFHRGITGPAWTARGWFTQCSTDRRSAPTPPASASTAWV